MMPVDNLWQGRAAGEERFADAYVIAFLLKSALSLSLLRSRLPLLAWSTIVVGVTAIEVYQMPSR